MSKLEGNFDLQLFADLVAEDGTILMKDSARFAIGQDGNIVIIEDEGDESDSSGNGDAGDEGDGNEGADDAEGADDSEGGDSDEEGDGDGEQSGDDNDGNGDDEEEPTYEVKADGKTVKLTLTQLLELAPKGINYTAKTQKLAEEKRQWEASRAQGNTPNNNQPPANSQAATGEDRFLSAVEKAKAIARRQLGLKPDDELTELDFTHQAAFNMALKAIVDADNAEATRITRINALEKELREKEPLFDEVFEYATQKMRKLPHDEFEELDKAWATGDTAKISKFFEGQRKNFYAEKNGSSTKPVKKTEGKKPPKVESAGNTPLAKTQQKTRDASVLAGLSPEEKAKKLLEWDLV